MANIFQWKPWRWIDQKIITYNFWRGFLLKLIKRPFYTVIIPNWNDFESAWLHIRPPPSNGLKVDYRLLYLSKWIFFTSIYRKPTFTGLLTKFYDFAPIQYKYNLISFSVCMALGLKKQLQSNSEPTKVKKIYSQIFFYYWTWFLWVILRKAWFFVSPY